MQPAISDVAGATWPSLGTTAAVFIDAPLLDDAKALLERRLDSLDQTFSRFRTDSELAHVNGAAGRPVRVSPLFWHVLSLALRAAVLTDGDVDPTLGSALRDVGYDRTFDAIAPDGPAVRVVSRSGPGWRSVRINAETREVSLPDGVALDFGAVAKAWCADSSAEAIAAATGTGVLVNLGGDIAVAGPSPAEGWPVRINDDRSVGSTVSIMSGGLATSSTSRRRWLRGGRLFHHILNPATGLPAEPVWSTVSVAGGSCVDANTASTAAIVRGVTALPWLHAQGLPARLVHADGSVVTVGGWPSEEAVA